MASGEKVEMTEESRKFICAQCHKSLFFDCKWPALHGFLCIYIWRTKCYYINKTNSKGGDSSGQ